MSQPRNKRATIVDVARAAGTSHATVSRHLNKTSHVSQQAAAAIEAAITAVNYTPNQIARSLVRRRSRAVAFIAREHAHAFFADPTLSGMAVGANSILSAEGYQMVVLIVDSDESAARIVDLVGGGWADGAILVAMFPEDPIVTAMASGTTPVITASRASAPDELPFVDTDNIGGAQRATRLLIDTGCRRIAEIHGPRYAPASLLRHEGYRSALGERYDDRLVVAASEWTIEAGRNAMTELLQYDPTLDGVVAASDLLAIGAIDALRHAGRRIPDEVSVVGFDDAPWASQADPPLSTVRQDAEETGRRLARAILRGIDGDDLYGFSEIIPNELVIRGSTRASRQ